MLDAITSRRTLYDAFERVRANSGCRGADGVTLLDFAANLETELDSLEDRLLRRRYHPFPLLRFEVPKSGHRVRHLSVPTVRDRVLQTAVYLVTREIFEAEFEECSYAFRQGRSVKNAVHRIDELRRQGFRWVSPPPETSPPVPLSHRPPPNRERGDDAESVFPKRKPPRFQKGITGKSWQSRPHGSPLSRSGGGRWERGNDSEPALPKAAIPLPRSSPLELGKAACMRPPSPGGREGDGRGGQGVRSRAGDAV